MHRFICMLLTLLLIFGTANALAEDYFTFMPTREHAGVTYEARNAKGLTTVLLIGFDHRVEGGMTLEQEDFIQGGQSDFLLLLVLDHDQKQIRQLQIDRDTMTDVKFFSKKGVYYGARKLQICLAHSYGDTQEMNNHNTIWAVENLLGIGGEEDGAQIDWYLSMDITGIGHLNDLLGGVTVPIEDDFSHYDPTMVMGTTMTLTGSQARIYCQQRYYIGEQTNASRMIRQRNYMEAAIQQLKHQMKENPEFGLELLNGMGLLYDSSKDIDEGFGFTTTDYQETPVEDTTHYLMTNKPLDTIAAMMARALDYEVLPLETLPGTHEVGLSGFMEFRAEKDAGLEWALDALYRPLK